METIIPKETIASLPALYNGDGVPLEQKTAHARVYSPCLGWSWYVFEAGVEEQFGLYFGWVHGDVPEMGYFSEQEWAEANLVCPGSIVFDQTFRPCPFPQVDEFHRRSGFWPRPWADEIE